MICMRSSCLGIAVDGSRERTREVERGYQELGRVMGARMWRDFNATVSVSSLK